jgi:hypothetical protein
MDPRIRRALIGGPVATPIKRMLLYNEVTVPRCFLSIPSVMSASKLILTDPLPA